MLQRTEPWNIGGVITRFREASRLSQRQVSELTRKIETQSNPEGTGIPTAQLSRIERGASVPDMREVYLLAGALGVSADAFLPGIAAPWYAIRFENALSWLDEIIAGTRIIERQGDSHHVMMHPDPEHDRKEPVYRYVPLVNQLGLADAAERSATAFPQLMQKYLFEVGSCDLEVVIEGLDSHGGEEIVCVLEGELEFWFQQTGEEPRFITLKKNTTLQYSSRLKHGYRAGGKDKVARALFVYTNIQTPLVEIVTPKQSAKEGGEPHETSD
jgi:transcriptional regulator with XRE-family HTH domain